MKDGKQYPVKNSTGTLKDKPVQESACTEWVISTLASEKNDRNRRGLIEINHRILYVSIPSRKTLARS